MTTKIIDLFDSEIKPEVQIKVFESEVNRLVRKYSKLKVEAQKIFNARCKPSGYLNDVMNEYVINIQYFNSRIIEINKSISREEINTKKNTN